ncbi:hypothetical protein Tcan_18107 [Toxocara canis]|uniref:Uncharacterized protein n=1 Tax=Toxocara canis TaxID=6265 RepID=A0A0B2UYG7_TOXCA|nr:hypothetical protein Tcan_18107 [Toxocara canis]
MGHQYERIWPPPKVGEAIPRQFVHPRPSAPSLYLDPFPPRRHHHHSNEDGISSTTDESDRANKRTTDKDKKKCAMIGWLKKFNWKEFKSELPTYALCTIATVLILLLIGLVSSGSIILLIVTKCFGNNDCNLFSSTKTNISRC